MVYSLTFLCALVGALLALLSPDKLLAAPVAGKAVSVEGRVSIQHAGTEATLNVGNAVEEGDWLNSAKGGAARILLSDNTILDLGPESRLQISHWTVNGEQRRGELQLDFGRVRSSINRKLQNKDSFILRTKASAFAVRGTDFFVEATRDSRLTVFEGKVNASLLSGTKAILVPAGARMLATTNALGQPGKLKPADLKALFQRARVEDRTFSQSVIVGDPTRTRSFGATTLRVLSGSGKLAPVAVPELEFKIPGIVLPNGSLITSTLQNYYPVQVKVGFQ